MTVHQSPVGDGAVTPHAEGLGPAFDEAVPPGGYRWHYLDAVTDDARLGIVLIAMVGNPFSPVYARARAAGRDLDPWRYTSMNIAVYGRGARENAWSFTERPQDPASTRPYRLTLGRSALEWQGGKLVATLDERTTPLGPSGLRRPLRGRIVFHPDVVCSTTVVLDEAREHRWWPIAPVGWVQVELEEPSLRFESHGYLDANRGMTALDASFDRWCWARARARGGAVISYDVTLRDGTATQRAFRIHADGACEPFEGLVRAPIGRTAWGIPRHAATAGPPRRLRTLEDGPFYAREIWEAAIAGERATVVHETLSARRLRQAWVQFCTAYRMRFED